MFTRHVDSTNPGRSSLVFRSDRSRKLRCRNGLYRIGYLAFICHDVYMCIEFRVAVLVWYSLIGQAPAYLTDLCCPFLSVRSTRHLRSPEQGLLHVPFARTSTMQSQASSVVGPLVWNGL